MKKILPIKPCDVVLAKLSTIPSDVIQCINKLITKHWDGQSSKFKQKELEGSIICALLDDRMPDTSEKIKERIHANKWLDFEPLYKKFGWNVYYDKPAYFEAYDATFEFTPVEERFKV